MLPITFRFLTWVKIQHLLVFCLLLMIPFSENGYSSENDDDLEGWIQQQSARSIQKLLSNVSRPDCARGSVVASPSKKDPDYYYHWIRDASIVLENVVILYERENSVEQKKKYESMIWDFINFSLGNQATPNLSGGPGEPKYYCNGAPFNGAWGRPQNDGAALRASAMIHFARVLLKEGRSDSLRKIYEATLPAQSVVKVDLEFISHQWHTPSFDLWEEVSGHHFFTRMVQRKALIEGAQLARDLKDPFAADWYQAQADALEGEISRHWNDQKGYVVATVNQVGGLSYKETGLDSGVILGALLGDLQDGFFSPVSEPILRTVVHLQETFQKLYEINGRMPSLAPAIGRYPEDRYDGQGESVGNPWFISTLSFAEFYYRAREILQQKGEIPIGEGNLAFFQQLLTTTGVRAESLISGQVLRLQTPLYQTVLDSLKKQGDSFLERVRVHSPADGALSEQFNRGTGIMQGAQDLTWSYSAFLSAVWNRPTSR